jgi:hypothetical protein
MDKKAYNPSGKCVVFNEAAHTYKVDKKQFTSVTTVLGEFFPKFDAERISYFVARREGKEQQEILDMWDKARDDACIYGTAVHLYAECKLLNEELPEPANKKEATAFKLLDKYIPSLLEDYEVVEAEKIIFSEKHELAGMIDLVLRNKKTGKYALLDWKTNKKIEKKNKHSKPAFHPIDHLNDSNYTKYQLQLNLYKYLMETEGYVDSIDDLILVHIRPRSVKVMKIALLTEEIENILQYLLDKKAKKIYNKDILQGEL